MRKFKSGDIVTIDFNPTKGHEQAGHHPWVIVNNEEYGDLMELTIVCPITNTNNRFPVHIPLDDRTKTTGVILCEHAGTVDLAQSNAKFVERLPENIFQEVQDIVISFFN